MQEKSDLSDLTVSDLSDLSDLTVSVLTVSDLYVPSQHLAAKRIVTAEHEPHTPLALNLDVTRRTVDDTFVLASPSALSSVTKRKVKLSQYRLSHRAVRTAVRDLLD